jgi:hypothetical protein
MNNYAIGVLTCDRPVFFKNCWDSITPIVCPKIVVNNSPKQLEYRLHGGYSEYISTAGKEPLSIAYGKNQIIKWFLERTIVEWLFIVEDDIIVNDCSVFDYYINTAETSRFKHLMFGLAGPNNFYNSAPHPVLILGKTTSFYRHCVGAFCLYHRSVLEKVGLLDERFINAMDHVEHSWRIAKAGFIPETFGFWPDVYNSNHTYLIDQDNDLKQSTMQHTPQVQYNKNVQEALKLFQELHGFHPYQKLEELNKLDEHNQITFNVIEQSQKIFKT